MKKFLKVMAILGSALLFFKALHLLIDVIYEQSNSRYITVEDDEVLS